MRTEHQTPFDAWLHVVLAREFGTPESEALPDELLALLPLDEAAQAA